MGFFDDNDPFEGILERMFGGGENFVEYSNGQRVAKRTENKSSKNFIETKKNVYFVLDLSNMRDIQIKIKDRLVANRFGEKVHNGEKILEIKNSNKESMEYLLPKNLGKKDFKWKSNNGILEVVFRK